MNPENGENITFNVNEEEKNASSETVALNEETRKAIVEQTEPIFLFNLPRRQFILVTLLLCSNLLFQMATVCMYPFFAEFAIGRGITRTSVGFFYGTYSAIGVVGSIIVGKCIPIFGVKQLTCLGFISTGICSLGLALSNQVETSNQFFWATFAFRSITSIGNSIVATCIFTIIANEFADKTSSILGFSEAFSGAGNTLGPLLGGIMFDLYGYEAPYLFTGIPIILAATICYVFLKVSKNKPEKVDEQTNNFGYWEIITTKYMPFMFFNIFFDAMAFSFNIPILEKACESFGISTSLVGFLFMSNALAYSFFAPTLGTLLEKYKMTNALMIFGNGALCFSYAIIGPMPFMGFERNYYTVCFAMIIQGLAGAAIFVPSFKHAMTIAVIENNFPDNTKTTGLISSVISGIFCLGVKIKKLAAWSSSQKQRMERTLIIFSFISFISLAVLEVYFAMRFVAAINSDLDLINVSINYYVWVIDFVTFIDVPVFLISNSSMRANFLVFYKMMDKNKIHVSVTNMASKSNILTNSRVNKNKSFK
uniref:MFS domain-containing protein n=1 Tax=Rhabditophanes sp. KR3021 TaxID=114890 RepID=A0AC35UEF2_9BILA